MEWPPQEDNSQKEYPQTAELKSGDTINIGENNFIITNIEENTEPDNRGRRIYFQGSDGEEEYIRESDLPINK